MPRSLLIALLLPFCAPAFAVYKCETGAAVSYTDAPCPGGAPLAISPAPANADARQAERQLAQQKKDLQQLETQRHRREAAEEKRQARLARAAAARQEKCAASALRVQWAEEDARRAAGKAAPKAIRKARRAAEKHQLECAK